MGKDKIVSSRKNNTFVEKEILIEVEKHLEFLRVYKNTLESLTKTYKLTEKNFDHGFDSTGQTGTELAKLGMKIQKYTILVETIEKSFDSLSPEEMDVIRFKYLNQSKYNHEQVMMQLFMNRNKYYLTRASAIYKIAMTLGLMDGIDLITKCS